MRAEGTGRNPLVDLLNKRMKPKATKPSWAGKLPPGTYPFDNGHGLRLRRDLLDRTPGKKRGWDVTTDFQPNQPPFPKKRKA